MKILIDADIVAFKAAAAVEKAIEWDDGLWTAHAYLDEGIEYCERYFNNVTATVGKGELTLFLTDKDNWRKDILPTYKASRQRQRKPVILSPMRDWMREMGAVQLPFLEADDLLGIAATNDGSDCIVVSEDKDLKTIPCRLYNPEKKNAVITIDAFTAAYNHMLQTLTGDTTDGYYGCPTIGPVKAKKILSEANEIHDLWPLVVEAYQKQKLSKEVALEQAQVAYICHASNYNTDTGKVTPWMPWKK